MAFAADSLIPDSLYELSESELEKIREVLIRRRGVDLTTYKEKYLRRRILIRMRKARCCSSDEYLRLLESDQDEAELLVKALTIHVTQFFRNPSTFAYLCDEVLPRLFLQAAGAGREGLTLWSVGCASGDEPYTLALILREHFRQQMEKTPVRIVGTDIDAASLASAAAAVYSDDRVAEIPPAILRRWFTSSTTEGHRLSPEVTEMVEFREGNLLDEGDYLDADLIICRNVLIYFERQEQENILRRFASHLGSGGIIVLGKSETLSGGIRTCFECRSAVERVYAKTA